LKIIGLIGGMSWESTVQYYVQINKTIKERLGGLHSAKIVLYSVDFDEVEPLMRAGDWEAAGFILADAARSLEAAGAAFLVMCTNTLHKVAPLIEAAVGVPLLHIADPTAAEIKRADHTTVGLLGARFTMEEASTATDWANVTAFASRPDAGSETIHRIIFDGVPGNHQRGVRGGIAVMASCVPRRAGHHSWVHGIPMLVDQQDSNVPVRTTAIRKRRSSNGALVTPSVGSGCRKGMLSAGRIRRRDRMNLPALVAVLTVVDNRMSARG
jgi:aspartate racemase